MKENKNGITLIALIITIIVMLILVGVTINVAVNGGLFEKTREAAKQTKKQVVYETIVSSIVLTDSGMVDPVATETEALSSLNSSGMTAVDIVESYGITPGYLRTIKVDDDIELQFLITYSRIIDISGIDLVDDNAELPKLTWADLAVTNVSKNATYKYGENAEFHFNETENAGISIEDENGILAESQNNRGLFMMAIINQLEIIEHDHLILSNGDGGAYEFIFEGNTLTCKSLNSGVVTDTKVYIKQ